jgi:hypothetical protein
MEEITELLNIIGEEVLDVEEGTPRPHTKQQYELTSP